MIRHIVLVRFRADVPDTEIASIFADLGHIRPNIPGMEHVFAGHSESPEKLERGYMHGFTVDFDSWEALAAYQDHPDHRRAGDAILAAAEGGLDGILVFDMEIKGVAPS